MDIEWRTTNDVLAKVRNEMARSRPVEWGCLLKPLAELHLSAPGKLSPGDADVFTDTVVEIFAAASLFERMAFTNTVADVGRLPRRLLERLLKDVYLVSRPLIERMPLSDGDLLGVMSTDTSESTLLVIAQRRGTGIPVTDHLVAKGTLSVMLALAANEGAALSPATFDRFSNMTTAQNDMDLALARRSDLPVSIAKALYERISERSARRLADMMERDRNRGRRTLVLGRN